MFFFLFISILLVCTGGDNVTSSTSPTPSTPSTISTTSASETSELPNNTFPPTTTITITTASSALPANPSVPCPEGFLNSVITQGDTRYGICMTSKDCLNIGFGKDERRLDPFCRFSEDHMTAGCCYKDTSSYCKQGVSVLPAQKCETLDDCNMRSGQTTERWCDHDSKQCCRAEHDEKPMLCPDITTALMDEPVCEGYDVKDPNSGKCPMKNGICFLGHCCPPIHMEVTNGYFQFVGAQIKGPSYETRHKCTNSTVISWGHMQGYCNPRTGTVSILGTLNKHGQPNKRLDSFCHTGLDCGQSSGLDNVCVRDTKHTLRCYVNPEASYYVPKAPNLTLISAFSYTALAASIISLIFAIVQKAGSLSENSRKSSSESSQPLVESQRVS